ncbi:MAG: enoyl-ACP reductase [Alphaproteobacteria bacterium]|nr:MAG: enoyl-ACP reductase [Alphaproteobacteria bacterium]
MTGKKGIIMGVANSNSIAWGIAQALHAHGAELAFTYQGDVLKKRVEPLAQSVGATHVLPCDVSDDSLITDVFATLGKAWGSLDFVVHAIAFADRDALRGRYVDTTRVQFLQAMDISCYSLTAVAAAAAPYMSEGGSIITLSYYGAEKVLPNYNVMGVAKAALEASVRYLAADLGPKNIRVNAISAGPVRTLAASGIGDLVKMLNWNKENAPLRRNVSLQDLGGTGVYFLSDLSHGVTGEIHYVDAGYNIMGMKASDAKE